MPPLAGPRTARLDRGRLSPRRPEEDGILHQCLRPLCVSSYPEYVQARVGAHAYSDLLRAGGPGRRSRSLLSSAWTLPRTA